MFNTCSSLQACAVSLLNNSISAYHKLHDLFGHLDVVYKTSELSHSAMILPVGPGCLASVSSQRRTPPISHPGLEVRVFGASSSAEALSPQDAQALECTLVHGPQVHTLRERGACSKNTVAQPPVRISRWGYSKIEPQSDQDVIRVTGRIGSAGR
ncbi:hypothetical protein Tco_0389892 [Tanacetum coccineum]